MTNRESISLCSKGLEDPSGRPQTAIAFPPMLIYSALLVSKDTILYSDKSRHFNHAQGYMLRGVEMTRVDISEIGSEIAPPTGTFVMRTKKPLPQYRDFIYGVTSIKIDGPVFEPIDYKSIKDAMNSRYAFNLENKYFTMNTNGDNHLYLICKRIRYVSIFAPFNSLLDVLNYETKMKAHDSNIARFLDMNFDVPGEYLQPIITMAQTFLLKPLSLIPGLQDDKSDDYDGNVKRDVAR